MSTEFTSESFDHKFTKILKVRVAKVCFSFSSFFSFKFWRMLKKIFVTRFVKTLAYLKSTCFFLKKRKTRGKLFYTILQGKDILPCRFLYKIFWKINYRWLTGKPLFTFGRWLIKTVYNYLKKLNAYLFDAYLFFTKKFTFQQFVVNSKL